MEEEVLTKNFVGWIVAFILFISLSITAIYARGLGDRLDALERHQEEQDTMHKTEIDCTNLYIESVKNELTASLEEQQEQIQKRRHRDDDPAPADAEVAVRRNDTAAVHVKYF